MSIRSVVTANGGLFVCHDDMRSGEWAVLSSGCDLVTDGIQRRTGRRYSPAGSRDVVNEPEKLAFFELNYSRSASSLNIARTAAACYPKILQHENPRFYGQPHVTLNQE